MYCTKQICFHFFNLVELEELHKEGFGEIKKIRNSQIFFKLPGTFVDEEVGPYINFLKISGQDVMTNDSLFRDVSKLSTELIAEVTTLILSSCMRKTFCKRTNNGTK